MPLPSDKLSHVIVCIAVKMQFVICTSPIIHFVSRQTFCITFLLGITVVPREIEDNAYAKFGGQTTCVMGDVQVANVQKVQ